jgi:hypothetical protein
MCAECGNDREFLAEDNLVRVAIVDGEGNFLRWGRDSESNPGSLDDPFECSECGSEFLVEVDTSIVRDKKKTREEIEASLIEAGLDDDDAYSLSKMLIERRSHDLKDIRQESE